MKSLTQCSVCGGGGLRPVFSMRDYLVSGESFSLVECGECGVRLTTPVPAEDQIEKYYESDEYRPHDAEGFSLSDIAYRVVRGIMVGKKRRWIERFTGVRGGRLLDVGCGTGEFAASMRDGGWDVTCVDASEKARSAAKSRFDLDVLSAEEWLNLESVSFDAITLWHTLEHVHQPRRYLTHARDQLSKDGAMFIALPNHTSYDAEVFGETWAAYDVPRHLTHFSPAAMKKLLERCNLSLSAIRGLPYDAYYVSLLSAMNGGKNVMSGLWNGFVSNRKAAAETKRFSSLIYVVRPKSIDDVMFPETD